MNKASAKEEKVGLKSFSIQGLKKNVSLIPLFLFVGAGTVGCFLYTLRLATRSPDVALIRNKNPEPWQEYENKQYKFWASKDYSTLPQPERPKF